ncbi:MAG: hypothetical protein HY288_10945, partial [Planctomycetia bacterium]|nr:hypothetical protein [Planctomycetia bacterium]
TLSSSQTVATFTDPGGAEVLADYGASINWGDSSSSGGTITFAAGTFTVAGAHTYAEEGSYPISVTLTHESAPNATAASTATVADAALHSTGINISSTVGLAFSGAVATFTDDNPSAPLSDYSATIDWGDSHTSAGTISLVSGVLTVSGTNTYDQQGSYPISVTINDVDGSTISATSTATVYSEVVGRELFYAGSPRYDLPGGSNGQTPNAFSDDNAIASDKSAYLPGSGAATFANLSSYDRGINGIMVDISGSHPSITLADILNDFTFKVGNDNSPGTWTAAPLPISVTVRPGAGVGSSDRVELIWADGAIQQQWLEVIVKATANTGLAADDHFFFGSEIADTGASNTATVAKVTSLDVTGVQTHGASLKTNIPLTDLYDFNRDGLVNSFDVTDAQTHGTSNKTGLQLIDIGAGGPFAPAPAAPAAASGSDAGVASGLAGTLTSTTAPPTIPVRIVNRLARLELNRIDLNSGLVAKYFEQLADEGTPKARAILVVADRVVDALLLEDGLLDSLVVGLKL